MGFWNIVERLPVTRHLVVSYTPKPSARAFVESAQIAELEDITVHIAALDARQSRRLFGVPMARRGIQPLWLRIENRAQTRCRAHLISIDPNYYSPHEAAAANHFSAGRHLMGLGLLGYLVLLPLLLLIPLKVLSAFRANRRMDELFRELAFPLRPIAPGKQSEGFVYTGLDVGSKVVHLRILRVEGHLEFDFNIPVAGIDADYEKRELHSPHAPEEVVNCDLVELFGQLESMPRAVTGPFGMVDGDPANLVVVGEFATILGAFGARWDETEVITLATCWKTVRSFLFGGEYRHSPVSPLYLFGRSQDFALQRIRASINERLHLRLWITNLRYDGKPVWVGQVSRDIGVRFTLKTWSLTTHRIDPDVDESRDYVLEDLIEAERVDRIGYVGGVGECDRATPRHNLTGDPYFTDGNRGIAIVSGRCTRAAFLDRPVMEHARA
ncbi:MAG: LssY C-terminal domain-containing protein [Phycisphaerae bacterium]|nr:LssY C-terminal domain-containing protein [Tepidisphaeraceae bacterium]